MSAHVGRLLVALAVAAPLLAVSPAAAQPPGPWVLKGRVRPGDMLTVTSAGRGDTRGRFVAGREDALVLQVGERQLALPWRDIDHVRRRRNGVSLGTIIGAGAGVAAGVPLAMLVENETGEGEQALATMIGFGLGVGIGLDALLARNRTVYRRGETAASVQLVPRAGGGAIRVGLSW